MYVMIVSWKQVRQFLRRIILNGNRNPHVFQPKWQRGGNKFEMILPECRKMLIDVRYNESHNNKTVLSQLNREIEDCVIP